MDGQHGKPWCLGPSPGIEIDVMMPRQEPEVGDLELGLESKFPQGFF